MRSSSRARASFAVVVASALAVSACGSPDDGAPNREVPVGSTEQVSEPATKSLVSSPNAGPAAKALAAAFEGKFADDVGVAITSVGGTGEVITLGDQTPRVAWSTIKVPLSIAALRHSPGDAKIAKTVSTAIINSDNDAALTLRKSLGTPAQGQKQMNEVFRAGGDPGTKAVDIKSDEETFGLTVWPLAGAAAFASNLPCTADADDVLKWMGDVAGNQDWGLRAMGKPRQVAVKGGWGPADGGGYEVRQLGVITHPSGEQTAVTMSTYVPGQTFEAGTATLNKVARWLDANLKKLPRGRCQA
ncbi:MAG: hypothetical protein QM658_06195 [Gordonia sp. (in: high G+C Gram-positive bacteria)]